jgi:glycosyltransferase involved in cell wall biosynthesis
VDQVKAVPLELAVGQRPLRKAVAVNISETRTRRFIAGIERKGFSFTDFQVNNWSAAVFRLPAFLRAVRSSEFVLGGTVLPWQIPWMILARVMRRPVAVDLPMDITAWPFPSTGRWRWLVRFSLRLADYVIIIRSRKYVVEKFGLARHRVLFLESCPDRAHFENAAFAAPRFRPAPGDFLICWSGGHAHHALERFMPIFEKLVALIAGAQLLVIADPELPSVVKTKEYAKSRGLAERVHMLPVIRPVEDFYATLAQCHLWVATLGDDTLQGRFEFRMELMEVGLLGKAVIAAPTPGLVAHGLSDGEEILYIDPAAAEVSALRIRDLVSNRARLDAMGRNLRARVLRDYSLEDAVEVLLAAVLRKP